MHSIMKRTATVLALGVAFAAPAKAELTGDLTIFLDTSNPAPRATMEAMIGRFGEKHPGLNIETTVIDREAYKTQIRNFLTANAPDVATWYAANRMRPYVEAGLFEDVSDLYAEPAVGDALASTKGALTIDDKQWGVAYTYYQWGVYYRKDIFDELGLSEPSTWDEEKANCAKIVESGRACYTIGTKYLWTAGGWFDYLNMRTNGFDFHMDLAAGNVSWEDDRVKATFANWAELIEMGAFIDNHQTYSWQEALPFMVKGEAAAYLMGNFAVAPLREAGLTDDQLDFYQFVKINPDVALSEDAPTDTFHIPSNAKNKEAAREFLRFATSADEQTIINNGQNLGQLPVNSGSSVDDDKFLNQGFEMLSTNSTGGVAQFWDRDAPAEMAKVSMEGFQEFMVKPGNIDKILAKLERARGRIYE
jgi:multiple sugar transport system substrate-binding protein